MTRQKRLQRRKAINASIAARDRANRCGSCKRALTDTRIERLGDERLYCSSDCVAEAAEREAR